MSKASLFPGFKSTETCQQELHRFVTNMQQNINSSFESSYLVPTSCQMASAPLAYERALRPSDILGLENEIRVQVHDPELHNARSCPKAPASPQTSTFQANRDVASYYVIPQKRVRQLKSLEPTPTTSAKRLQKLWYSTSKSRAWKEKVVGGLSKDDELQAMWANFDEEEGRKRFRSNFHVEDKMLSGNDVLGAWEEELMLNDLNREEGPW